MDNTTANKTISLQIRKLVIRDIEKGESHRKIAEKYGCSKAAKISLIVLSIRVTLVVGYEIDCHIGDCCDNASLWNCQQRTHPYHVALFKGKEFLCGGSIVDRQWILTAAHCVIELDGSISKDVKVLAGTAHLKKGGTYLKPDKIFPHEQYGSSGNDIALIKLEKTIEFNEHMQKIELSAAEVPDNSSVIITGHGRTGNGEPISEILKHNTMYTLSDEECHAAIQSERKGIMCINNQIDNGACLGDSGGPAVYDSKQVGVANFYITMCGGEKPDGYAKVAYYADWIAETMKK
ncbi:serine protease SP24D-like [Wyeomyia smithii]|uniref:serine protease SP24D-like n=1 Tax=Wyeomyia smithii TaxID=174621 RepID=UPI002467D42B|nr:serine protease SP24D-like [Wyeomyia smithii]